MVRANSAIRQELVERMVDGWVDRVEAAARTAQKDLAYRRHCDRSLAHLQLRVGPDIAIPRLPAATPAEYAEAAQICRTLIQPPPIPRSPGNSGRGSGLDCSVGGGKRVLHLDRRRGRKPSYMMSTVLPSYMIDMD